MNYQKKLKLAFDRLDFDCQQIVDRLALHNNSMDSPDELHHYTNDFGLKGILETKRLFITDAYNLNDPSELRHGLSILFGILNESKNIHPIFEHLFDGYSKFNDNIGNNPIAHCYILSFSMIENDLSQWRLYADNGRGYSLEFDTEALEMSFLDGNRKNRATYYVKYEHDQIMSLNKKFIEFSGEIITIMKKKVLGNKLYSDCINELLRIYTLYTLRSSLFFKHEAYVGEKEYRFLEMFPATEPDPFLNYRCRASSLVKYREFNFDISKPLPIKSITIGPAADHNKATKFVKECLRFYGCGEIKIKYSDIPYRAV
jgi:hypothetical protein